MARGRARNLKAVVRGSVLCGLVMLLGACGSNEPVDSQDQPVIPKSEPMDIMQGELTIDRSDDRPPQRKQLNAGDEAKRHIADYRERLETAEGEEAAALWFSMGNLYRQKLGDYEAAAQSYEAILADYPDWSRISEVYTQLVTAYENLQDHANVRDICIKMKRHYPPESSEYKFADAKLQGEL